MFDWDVMLAYFNNKIRLLYKQTMCDHECSTVVVRDDDSGKVEVCSNCLKVIKKRKLFWRK